MEYIYIYICLLHIITPCCGMMHLFANQEVKNHQVSVCTPCLCLICCLFFLPCIVCEVAVDLYLAVDSTKTLGQDGHNTMKTWAETLVDLFDIGTTASSGVTRVEVTQFWGNNPSFVVPDSHAEVDIGLGGYNDKNDLKEKIKGLIYHHGESTIIPHGLSLLSSEIPKYQIPSRKTYVLVLTDGVDDTRLGVYRNPPAGSLEYEARELKKINNIKVLAIGFQGTNFDEKMDQTNLETIASSYDNVVYGANLADSLNKTYSKLITLCQSITLLRTQSGEFIIKCRKIMVS